MLLVILAMLARFRASGIYFSWVNLSGTCERIWDNIRRGWNVSEYWSLDGVVCKFILPRLKEFKEKIHGHPSGLLPDEKADDFESGMKEWRRILDKMIFSFECIINDNEDIEMPHMNFKTVDSANGHCFLEHDCTPEEEIKHRADMKVYSEKMDVRQKEIQEGLQLFAEYFQSLWD